jgi:dipeptidyl aminopeptidase/acylaminoacyl peptidase
MTYAPLDPAEVRVEPEGLTVERNWVLSLYTWLHSRDYRSFRVGFTSEGGDEAVAHLLVPPGDGRHAGVMVFPILAGSHVVSEGLAKALVNRGFVVLRMERRPLEFDTVEDPVVLGRVLRRTLLDARRILDWFVARPEIDPDRIAVAGVSLGGILAASLLGLDTRIRAGFFLMAGGGIAELLHDSTEKPVRRFRDRMQEHYRFESRDAFVDALRPYTEPVDPLRYAPRIDPRSVLLVSGRFDRVVPPARTRTLWEALDRPTWIRVPVGHYQLFPFFWWAIGRGADHLEHTLTQVTDEGLQQFASLSEARDGRSPGR